MKKLFVILLAALLLVSFISCEKDTSDKMQEKIEQEEPTPAEPTETTTVNVPLPVFGDASSSGRGLKTMPVDYFEGDHQLACAVMTIMPTMTNLEAAEINISGTSLKNVKASFTVFGFDVELVTASSHINKDGIYLQYRLLYEGTNVGFCDYYYNIEKKTFSYRQSVFCTFAAFPDNEILNIEYIDIPVENALEPVFRVGQLTEEGVLDDDAFVDNIWINTPSPTKAELTYNRAFITLNEVKENDGLYTMYAFKQPDNSFKMGPVEYDGEFAVFKTVLAKYLDNDDKFIIDTDKERTKADFELMKEIYPLVYKNGQSIADHHSTVKGYTSYADFVADSFREQTEVIKNYSKSSLSRTTTGQTNPVIYRYNGKKSTGAATSRTPKNNATGISVGLTFTALNGNKGEEYSEDKGYTLLGFKDFFGDYNSKENSVTVADFTTEKFLKACGIDNEAYIKAFIEYQNAPTATGRIKINL